ncbi:hypothetical protein [Bacillus sp. NEB1478]|uniref:hypothetical protein n=1 Tax=Bacillus sp. NEB1478 TaxID=3073816 RepID=UPI002873AF48|nr:hypothetical protein [Bacillus sp. NEB1478]WNB93422.1 hypothetical protein RGB74_07060 [Bacillus sp. NEB1478]
MSTDIEENVETIVIQNVDKDKEIERIESLLEKETEKKLDVVKHYLLRHHGVNQAISNVEQLKTYLRTDDVDEEILIGIYEELDQSFSQGYPNFIYEYKLNDGNALNELKTKIETCLPLNAEKTYRENIYTYIKRVGEVTILDGDLLKFPVTYEKFKERVDFGGLKSKGDSESKTTFDVVFDSSTELCFIQCGEKTQANVAYRVIHKHVTRIFNSFDPFSVSRKKLRTTVENEHALDKQTIILLDYIEKTINEDGHEINDYLSVAFANKKQNKKVRSVRLSGNNLLESYEVGDRVRLGDQIKSVRFQLRFQTGENMIEMVNVSVDFQATLKIKYTNLNNKLNVCNINRHLISKINKSLTKVYKEQEVDASLKEIVARAKVRDFAFLVNVLGQVKEDINQLSLSAADKANVLDVINKYLTEE